MEEQNEGMKEDERERIGGGRKDRSTDQKSNPCGRGLPDVCLPWSMWLALDLDLCSVISSGSFARSSGFWGEEVS